jgi:hypothetical protein
LHALLIHKNVRIPLKRKAETPHFPLHYDIFGWAKGGFSKVLILKLSVLNENIEYKNVLFIGNFCHRLNVLVAFLASSKSVARVQIRERGHPSVNIH